MPSPGPNPHESPDPLNGTTPPSVRLAAFLREWLTVRIGCEAKPYNAFEAPYWFAGRPPHPSLN